MNVKRKIVLALLVLTVLAVLDLGCYWELSIAAEQAQRALYEADLCQRVAQHIIALQARPAIAGTQEQAQEELTRRIETAARGFGIGGDNLAAIEPDPAVRVADTSYLEKPTTVDLRQVSLRQLVNLLCRLTGDGRGLSVKSLRLTAPPQNPDGDQWSVEVTLTYLIYSPLPVPEPGKDKNLADEKS